MSVPTAMSTHKDQEAVTPGPSVCLIWEQPSAYALPHRQRQEKFLIFQFVQLLKTEQQLPNSLHAEPGCSVLNEQRVRVSILKTSFRFSKTVEIRTNICTHLTVYALISL